MSLLDDDTKQPLLDMAARVRCCHLDDAGRAINPGGQP